MSAALHKKIYLPKYDRQENTAISVKNFNDFWKNSSPVKLVQISGKQGWSKTNSEEGFSWRLIRNLQLINYTHTIPLWQYRFRLLINLLGSFSWQDQMQITPGSRIM